MTSNETEADDGATDTSPQAEQDDARTSAGTTARPGTEAPAQAAPDGDGVAPGDDTDAGTDTDTDTETGTDTDDADESPEDRDAALDGEEGEEEDEGPSRVVLLVGAAVAFVAIAIVGILIASGGGDSGGGSDEEGAAPADARADVGIFGTIDQFDRPDSATSMGDFAPGRPWSADAGTWGIDGGAAYLVESSEFRNH